MWEDLFHIVRLSSENIELADEIVCKAQTTIHMLLLWNLRHLEESMNKDHLNNVKKYQVMFMRYLHQLLFHTRDKISEDVRIG